MCHQHGFRSAPFATRSGKSTTGKGRTVGLVSIPVAAEARPSTVVVAGTSVPCLQPQSIPSLWKFPLRTIAVGLSATPGHHVATPLGHPWWLWPQLDQQLPRWHKAGKGSSMGLGCKHPCSSRSTLRPTGTGILACPQRASVNTSVCCHCRASAPPHFCPAQFQCGNVGTTGFHHRGGFLSAPWRWGGRTLAIPFPHLLATPGGSSLNLTSNCLEHVPAQGWKGQQARQAGKQASLLQVMRAWTSSLWICPTSLHSPEGCESIVLGMLKVLCWECFRLAR